MSAAIAAVAAAAGSAKRDLAAGAPQAFAAATEAVSDAVSSTDAPAVAGSAGKAKGKSKKGGLLLLFGIGAAAAAAVAVVMSRKPKDDPWAAPVTETAYLPPTTGRASTVAPVADQPDVAPDEAVAADASAALDDEVTEVTDEPAEPETAADAVADAEAEVAAEADDVAAAVVDDVAAEAVAVDGVADDDKADTDA